MLKFSHVILQGFLNIDKAVTVRLDEPGLNLVIGENGAGKSTRYTEGLFWCLYGTTIRKLKSVDSVIHRESATAYVEADITDSETGETLKIVREKQRGKAQTLQITKGGILAFPAANLAEKQARLEEWLGLDANTFLNAVVFGQDVQALFASGLSDAERKAIFDRICGLDEYDRAFSVASAQRHTAEVDLSVRQTKLEDARARLGTMEEEVVRNTENLTTLNSEIEAARTTLAEQIERTQQELDAAKTSRAEAKAALQAAEEVRDLLPPATGDPETIRDRKAALELRKPLMEEKAALDSGGRTVRSRIAVLNAETLGLQESIKTSKCSQCGTVLSNLAEVEKKVATNVGGLRDLEAEALRIDTKTAEVTAQISEIDEFIGQCNTLILGASRKREDAARIVDACQRTVSALRTAVDAKEKTLVALGGSCEALENRFRAAEKSLLDLRTDVATKQAEIVALDKAREDAAEKVQIARFWEEGFGPKGIKALLIENILPYLNQLINEHLAYLSDGKMSARLSTITELKTGRIAERLSIDVENLKGAESFDGNSGGEKRRINLAILLGFQDLVGTRASRAVDLAIYDEVLDALDEAGMTKAVAYLKARSAVKPTYVIAHNAEAKALIEDVIRVEAA